MAGKRFTKKDVLTIPNLISVFRLALIPVLVYQYLVRGSIPGALIVLGLSGLSDVLDGYIARKYDMVSDLGKILDPVADKLTQGALIFSLVRVNRVLLWLFILLAIKEVVQASLGLAVIKNKGTINSSHWYGKMCTVVIYFSMLFILVWSNMPEWLVYTLFSLCVIAMAISLFSYIRLYVGQLRAKD